MKIAYILIGLYKNGNFTYARAALIPSLKTSLIAKSKAQEIKCLENLEQKYTIYLDTIGLVSTGAICSIDSIATVKHTWRIKTVLHVVEDEVLKKLKCEVALGIDCIMLLGPKILSCHTTS